MYHTWLTLTDPTDEREGIMGYLFVDVAVLGPNDEMVVHEVSKKDGAKKDSTAPVKVKLFGHVIQFQLIKAENMPPLDLTTDSIDAYVHINYSGGQIKSSVVTSRNPVFHEQLNLATFLPN